MQEDLRNFLRAELDSLRERHLFRNLRVVYGRQAPVCNIDGKEVINLSSNNASEISLPATVTIPAGQTFATFSFTKVPSNLTHAQ